jgi:LacI family transcriptional regulator
MLQMRRPRVMLVIESSRAYGRGCLLGIAAYARSHGPWSFLHLERGLNEGLPREVRRWRGDGIIARIENRSMAAALARLRLPIVDLRGRGLLRGVASFNTDPSATARLAAEHFLERGFRHLAFCGLPGIDFSDRRSAEFIDHARGRAASVAVFQPRRRRSGNTLEQELRGSLDHADLTRWLATLPRPVGVMACNDARGRQVLDACAEAPLRVPEEVAVIGVDNDQVLCDLSNPPLSSVEPDVYTIGYRAAEMLAAMMQTGRRRGPAVEVPPRGIVTRRSSDILAISDPTVAEAIHLIRENAQRHFNVEDLLDRLPVSRATLERRFMSALGRSPKQEILQTRLARVRQLLADTDYPLSRIAALTGFKTASHLSVAWKSHFHSPPGQLRAGTSSAAD